METKLIAKNPTAFHNYTIDEMAIDSMCDMLISDILR